MKQSTSNLDFESIFFCPWTIVKQSGLEGVFVIVVVALFVWLVLFSEAPLVKPNYSSENGYQMENGSLG